MTAMASTDTAPARPQPASRLGSASVEPGSETGRMKLASSAVVAPARTELTDPAKSTTKATTNMLPAASQVLRDARVARLTRTAPASTSPACAVRRSRIGPVKSAKSSIESEPNAANSRHGRVADDLLAEREERGHDDGGPRRPAQRGQAGVTRP